MHKIEVDEKNDNLDLNVQEDETIIIDVDLENTNEVLEVEVNDDPYEIDVIEEEGEEVAVEENSERVYFKDYNILDNKPSLNHVTLEGDKSLGDLGIVNDKNYIHLQNTASNTWTINHNLNKYPAITVVDSAGNEVVGDIEYIDANNLRIIFRGAFKGKATLN